MDEITEKIEFTFAELNESAKSTARDKWRESDLDYEWWEHTYEDATTIGALIGISIGTRTGKYNNGKSWSQPDINFNGFSSQGDGCCFQGELLIGELNGAAEKLKEHVGEDEELFALAVQSEALHDLIIVRLMELRLLGNSDEDPDDEIGALACVQITNSGRSYSTRTSPDSCPDNIETAMNEYVSGFADWIYNSLEAEHDHLTSDESVEEAIRSNGCFFNEHGSII